MKTSMTGREIRSIIQQLHDDLVRGTEALRRQIRAARDERDRKVEQLQSVCPHENDGHNCCKWCDLDFDDD